VRIGRKNFFFKGELKFSRKFQLPTEKLIDWRELLGLILLEEFSWDFSTRKSYQMMIDFTSLLEKNPKLVKSNPLIVKEILTLFDR
jgi:hypothetical protein